MNNDFMTYEEYLDWDREYRYYESLIELRMMFVENLDRDDMDYPPVDCWETCVDE